MHIPSSQTVACDTQVVFEQVKGRIANMLQVSSIQDDLILIGLLKSKIKQDYNGHLNFATDAWTSLNSHACVALTVHFERKGEAVALLLDIVKVAKSHSGVNLGKSFANVLRDFGISDKVTIRFSVKLKIAEIKHT